MKEELITHAAIKAEVGGFIALGKAHSECFHQAASTGIKLSRKAKAQGFMTNFGRFVDREEAFHIAVAAGQISPEGNGGVLCSEDLWSPRHNGKYSYDYVRGYFL
jgi:hypothetical protein